MEKLKMQSHDVTGSNTQKIAQLFPNCVTERLGEDGKPELAIDLKRLQSELSTEILEAGEDRYQFMRLTLRPYGLLVSLIIARVIADYWRWSLKPAQMPS